MPETDRASESDHSKFRMTLGRVMAVQVVALLLLWLLQAYYTP